MVPLKVKLVVPIAVLLILAESVIYVSSINATSDLYGDKIRTELGIAGELGMELCDFMYPGEWGLKEYLR